MHLSSALPVRKPAAELQCLADERSATIPSLPEPQQHELVDVSGELRTQLERIPGLIQRLLQHSQDASLQSTVQLMRSNARRFLGLIDQLPCSEQLRFEPALARSRCSADLLRLAGLCHSFQAQAEEKGIRVCCAQLPPLRLAISADLLEQVVNYLLSDIIKYAPPAARIELRAHKDAQHGVIEIRGAGISAPVAQRESILDRRYRRSDEAGQQLNDSGNSLALVRELLADFHGSVEVGNVSDKGSVITVRLPLSPKRSETHPTDVERVAMEPESIAERARSETSQSGDASASEASGGLVLLVSDDPDLRALFEQTLAGRYRCIARERADEALELVGEEIPDLVICELIMFEMDEFALARALRSSERTRQIPVILLIDGADRRSRTEGCRHHIGEYLTKRNDKAELGARITGLLDGREAGRQRFARALPDPGPEVDPRQGRGLDPVDQAFLQRFQDLIDEQYADPRLRVTDISSRLAISERPLQRRLKALLGETPMEYLRRYRLRKAKRLLETKSLPVNRVAEAVGIENQAYFAARFKAQFGTTPREWRKLCASQG